MPPVLTIGSHDCFLSSRSIARRYRSCAACDAATSHQKLGGEPCRIPVTSLSGIVCRLRGRLRERDGGGRLSCGVALMGVPAAALADEAGIGFWVPGIFGSLAAAPLTPGFSMNTVYSIRRSRAAATWPRRGRFHAAASLGPCPSTSTPCERGLGCGAGYSDLCVRDAGPRWAGGDRPARAIRAPQRRCDQTISARIRSNAFSLSGAAERLR